MRRAGSDGLWRGFFREGGSGNLSDFQRALRGQHVHAVYGGDGDHRDALRIHRSSDPDPAQTL